MRTGLKILFTLFLTGNFLPAFAAQKPITATLKSRLASGHTIIAVGKTNGRVKTAAVTGKSIRITPPESKSYLYVLGSDNQIAYQVVNAACSKTKSGKDKGQYATCSKTSVNTVFNSGAKLGTIAAKGRILRSTLTKSDYSKAVDRSITARAVNYVPVGLATNGLPAAGSMTPTMPQKPLKATLLPVTRGVNRKYWLRSGWLKSKKHNKYWPHRSPATMTPPR